MAFTRRQPAPVPATAAAEPEPATASAAERLAAIGAEQAAIAAELAEHQRQRAAILEADDGDLAEVRRLKEADEDLGLQLDRLARRQAEAERDWQAEYFAGIERAWAATEPALAEAQQELAMAIGQFHDALDRCHRVRGQAHGFGEERLQKYVRPPPPEAYNRWALLEYVKAVELRRTPATVPSDPYALAVEPALRLPGAPKFQPRRVPASEVEAISPLGPARFIRVLHGPVRTAHLNFGIARMFVGEEHMVPPRAAYALVQSGIAQYLDTEQHEASTAAA